MSLTFSFGKKSSYSLSGSLYQFGTTAADFEELKRKFNRIGT